MWRDDMCVILQVHADYVKKELRIQPCAQRFCSLRTLSLTWLLAGQRASVTMHTTIFEVTQVWSQR